MHSRAGLAPSDCLRKSQQFDASAGLYSLRARYYQAVSGRFLTRDVATYDLKDPSIGDRYVYAANDPVNAIDPAGWQAMAEYSQIQSEDAEAEPALAEEGGELAQSVYDNSIYDPIEDLAYHEELSNSTSAAQQTARSRLIQTVGHKGEALFDVEHPGLSTKQYVRSVQRFIDFWDADNQIAYEVKTGYQALSSRIRAEIAKDVQMLSEEKAEEVVWYFYRSPITGKIGASQPLLDELFRSGIRVVYSLSAP